MKLDDIKKLQQKKYRQAFAKFLVEGEHLILELAKAAKTNTLLFQSRIYASESYRDANEELSQQLSQAFEVSIISDKQLQKLSDTKSPQGILAVVPLAAIAKSGSQTSSKNSDQATRSIYLYEVQDPGNLGTILRTLAWFGNLNCLLSPNSVDPFNPKVVRASMGAIFHVSIEVDVSIENLKQNFNHFACLDIQGQALSSPNFKQHQCFIFGNEARGVPHEQLEKLKVERFSIAGSGALESLNLATAVNICSYELNR